MVFVTVNNDTGKLKELSALLYAAFPGSVIHEYTDPMLSAKHIVNTQVDAVLAEAKMRRVDGAALLYVLRIHKPELPVFILSDTDECRETALEMGANEYLVRPISEADLRAAVQAVYEIEAV